VEILADENIPSAQEAFEPLGELRLVPAARIAAQVQEAEVLIVRSVTRVGEALLAGSRVGFVGTATAGIDHIDTDYLAKRGIAFASAAGCNSTAVAQHVAAFLCALQEIWDQSRSRSIGIVGVGRCGSEVEKVARALGFEPVLCDPPLARHTGSARFRPLTDLRDCDVVTLHTPLMRSGADRTEGMIDEAYLGKMKPGGIVINAARGGLVVEAALVGALRTGQLGAAALDVWHGEPRIDLAVLDAVTLATPHVAGYSHEGRSRGTETIHAALCHYLGVEPSWTCSVRLRDSRQTIRVSSEKVVSGMSVAAAVLEAHPVERIDTDLRRLSTLPRHEHASYFENLRKTCMRHEFSAYTVLMSPPDPDLAVQLEALGFSLADRPPSRIPQPEF
jgi:erythronate-4-phosphate dehydrogenase